jgi:truncated hemoglobin YjbI
VTDKPVIQQPHYAVEDIPPDDVDTKLQLFEQSTDVVKGSAEAADWLLKNAEIVLGEVFSAAEKAKDTELAERVNDLWSGVQTTTGFLVRQSAVITGSKETIAALKAQRDKLVADWNSVREALAGYDTDHPELVDYAETLQEMWQEYNSMWYDDTSYDIAFDNIRDDMLLTFRNRVGMTQYQAGKAFDLIVGTPGLLTDEQIGILKQFAATLPQRTDVTLPDDEGAESDD